MVNGKLHTITIMRKFGIDAGHRLWQHEGKCKHLHGHRYEFQVWFTAEDLDSIGRVIDFSEIKNKIGGWLEANWDHGMILNENDPIAKLWGWGDIEHSDELNPLDEMKSFLLPCNPTAENLASYLLKIANELMLDTGVKVTKVGVYETPNCMASAEL